MRKAYVNKVRIAGVGEVAEKKELGYTLDGSADWYSPSGRLCGESLNKNGVATQGIHVIDNQTLIGWDICTLMFIAV